MTDAQPEGPQHFLTAVWSDRLMRFEPVWVRAEATEDEGSLIDTGVTMLDQTTQAQVPIFEYRPGRDGTHTPLGVNEMEAAGLRDPIPTYDPEVHGAE